MDQVTHAYKYGDILVASWGYSMTIVDFYKVIKTTSKTVSIVQIGKRDYSPDPQSGFAGHVMPNPNNHQSKPMVRRISSSGTVRGHNSSCYARPWDGKPAYYNHND